MTAVGRPTSSECVERKAATRARGADLRSRLDLGHKGDKREDFGNWWAHEPPSQLTAIDHGTMLGASLCLITEGFDMNRVLNIRQLGGMCMQQGVVLTGEFTHQSLVRNCLLLFLLQSVSACACVSIHFLG